MEEDYSHLSTINTHSQAISQNFPPTQIYHHSPCNLHSVFLGTNWKFNCKKEPKIQPTCASQRNPNGDQEIEST